MERPHAALARAVGAALAVARGPLAGPTAAVPAGGAADGSAFCICNDSGKRRSRRHRVEKVASIRRSRPLQRGVPKGSQNTGDKQKPATAGGGGGSGQNRSLDATHGGGATVFHTDDAVVYVRANYGAPICRDPARSENVYGAGLPRQNPAAAGGSGRGDEVRPDGEPDGIYGSVRSSRTLPHAGRGDIRPELFLASGRDSLYAAPYFSPSDAWSSNSGDGGGNGIDERVNQLSGRDWQEWRESGSFASDSSADTGSDSRHDGGNDEHQIYGVTLRRGRPDAVYSDAVGDGRGERGNESSQRPAYGTADGSADGGGGQRQNAVAPAYSAAYPGAGGYGTMKSNWGSVMAEYNGQGAGGGGRFLGGPAGASRPQSLYVSGVPPVRDKVLGEAFPPPPPRHLRPAPLLPETQRRPCLPPPLGERQEAAGIYGQIRGGAVTARSSCYLPARTFPAGEARYATTGPVRTTAGGTLSRNHERKTVDLGGPGGSGGGDGLRPVRSETLRAHSGYGPSATDACASSRRNYDARQRPLPVAEPTTASRLAPPTSATTLGAAFRNTLPRNFMRPARPALPPARPALPPARPALPPATTGGATGSPLCLAAPPLQWPVGRPDEALCPRGDTSSPQRKLAASASLAAIPEADAAQGPSRGEQLMPDKWTSPTEFLETFDNEARAGCVDFATRTASYEQFSQRRCVNPTSVLRATLSSLSLLQPKPPFSVSLGSTAPSPPTVPAYSMLPLVDLLCQEAWNLRFMWQVVCGQLSKETLDRLGRTGGPDALLGAQRNAFDLALGTCYAQLHFEYCCHTLLLCKEKVPKKIKAFFSGPRQYSDVAKNAVILLLEYRKRHEARETAAAMPDGKQPFTDAELKRYRRDLLKKGLNRFNNHLERWRKKLRH